MTFLITNFDFFRFVTMSKLLLLLSCVSLSVSLQCNTLNHAQKHKNVILFAEIYCKNVPSSLIIDKMYFTEEKYPQDVFITESEIPTIPNYSSLLNMKFVRKLVLKGLGIKNIIPGAFRNMKNLQELDLSFNNIKKLSGDVFQGLENLETLNLVGNELSEDFDDLRKFLPNLKHLYLKMETNAI